MEMFSFHAHSRGEVVRHVALLDRAHTGTLTVQLALLVHATPPQCSAPSGGAAAWHWVSDRRKGALNTRAVSENLRVLLLGFGIVESKFHLTSRAQRNPPIESTASGTKDVRKATFTTSSSL